MIARLLAVAALLLAGTVVIVTQADADNERNCVMTAVEKSICVYEAILNDVRENYTFAGGGGISAIRQTMTTTYEVTIAQEERADVWTYEIAVDDAGAVKILNRTEGTR
jgi:hypothetical protein